MPSVLDLGIQESPAVGRPGWPGFAAWPGGDGLRVGTFRIGEPDLELAGAVGGKSKSVPSGRPVRMNILGVAEQELPRFAGDQIHAPQALRDLDPTPAQADGTGDGVGEIAMVGAEIRVIQTAGLSDQRSGGLARRVGEVEFRILAFGVDAIVGVGNLASTAPPGGSGTVTGGEWKFGTVLIGFHGAGIQASALNFKDDGLAIGAEAGGAGVAADRFGDRSGQSTWCVLVINRPGLVLIQGDEGDTGLGKRCKHQERYRSA